MSELTKEELMAPVKTPELKGSGRQILGQALGTNLDFATKRADIRKGIGKAEKDILTGEQEQKELLATGESEAGKKYAEAEKGAMQSYQEKLGKEPLPAFIPTKDTAQDLAGMFSLVAVMGMFAGKQNGQLAMNAMNGMLEGYQKGRKDLYEKERKEFEANFKSMLKKHEEFRKEMEDAVKLAATDREAGMQAAKLAAVKSGSKIINAKVDKGDLVGAYEDLAASEKGAQHLSDMYTRLVQHEETLSQQRELAKIKAGSGGALPKDTKTNDEHRFRYSAMENVQDVLDELQKPEVRNLIGPQNQFTPDVLLNLQKGFPELAQKLARFQSQEFQIGGKSLTNSEQKILSPIYNWRGLTADALESNLKEAERAMGKEQQYLENRYPGLKEFNYGGSSARPEQTSKYTIGQEITSGNKKYRVVGLTDPNDPDLEEIK